MRIKNVYEKFSNSMVIDGKKSERFLNFKRSYRGKCFIPDVLHGNGRGNTESDGSIS